MGNTQFLKISKQLNLQAKKLRFLQVKKQFANLEKKAPYLTEALLKAKPYLKEKPDKVLEIIEWIGQCDPKAVASNKKKTPFVNQILDWYIKGQIRLPEDIDQVKNALQEYHRLHFNSNLMPEELSSFASIQDFYDALTFYSEQLSGEQERESQKNTIPLPVVFTSEDFIVYELPERWTQENDQLMSKLFEGTRWCVGQAMPYNSLYKPPYYMVFNKRSGKRLALVNPGSSQFKNPSDGVITDPDLIHQLKPFVGRIAKSLIGDFAVFIGLDSVEIATKLSSTQLTTALLSVRERLPEQIESLVLNRVKEDNSFLSKIALYEYSVRIKDQTILKIAKDELDTTIKANITFESNPLEGYRDITNFIVRYSPNFPKDLGDYLYKIGYEWFKRETSPKRLRLLTLIAIHFKTGMDDVQKLTNELIAEKPAGFAFLVRKKKKPIPALEERGEASLKSLLDNPKVSRMTIRDAISGLVEYYYNAHEGKMPEWIIESFSNLPRKECFLIPSRSAMIGLEQSSHRGPPLLPEWLDEHTSKVALNSIVNAFLQSKGSFFADLEKFSTDLLSLFIKWQQLLETPVLKIRDGLNRLILRSYIESTRLFDRKRPLQSDFPNNALSRKFLEESSFKIEGGLTSSVKSLNLFYINFQGQELEFPNVSILTVHKKRITIRANATGQNLFSEKKISLRFDKINHEKTHFVDKKVALWKDAQEALGNDLQKNKIIIKLAALGQEFKREGSLLPIIDFLRGLSNKQ